MCYDTDDEEYDEDKVRMLKLKYTAEELCEGLPDCFLSYLKYVRGLGFDQEPDYCFMRELFTDYYEKCEYEPPNETKFDWVILKEKILTDKLALEE